MNLLTSIAERGFVPDRLIRSGIRCRLRKILQDHEMLNTDHPDQIESFLDEMEKESIAPSPEKANHQHYDLPPEFFSSFLGQRMKYSCCFWGSGARNLNRAEDAMLELTCRRAGIINGQSLLDLGCGWGSLSFYMAEKYPDSTILAVSNSREQVEFVLQETAQRGLKNLDAVIGEVSSFHPNERFDKIISIEMFEHMRNWKTLFKRIASWLNPNGLFFCHFFCNCRYPYFFRSEEKSEWMGHYFFTGGMMPSFFLPTFFQEDLHVIKSWKVSGNDYSKTLEVWLRNLDDNKDVTRSILEGYYGKNRVDLWFQRWRIFLLACSELFSYNEGQEWYVAHYLMEHARES